jgi:hypothetical protein
VSLKHWLECDALEWEVRFASKRTIDAKETLILVQQSSKRSSKTTLRKLALISLILGDILRYNIPFMARVLRRELYTAVTITSLN